MCNDHPETPADGRLARAASEGCAESRLVMSRRAMLGVTAGLFSWAFMPKFAEAAGASADPRLVVAILRGGMDGLTTVIPHGDPLYVSTRGDLAIPEASSIPLDSFFSLHPAMPNFGGYFAAGDAAIVHATCVPVRSRSHFDGQDSLENGMAGIAPNATGWLNRLLTALPAGAPVKARGAIEIGRAPLILRGPAPVLGWSPATFSHLEDPVRYMVRTLYRERDPQLLDMLDRGIAADRMAEGLGGGFDTSTDSVLVKSFRGAGRLVASPTGPRIAVLSVDGWDTHANQGILAGGLSTLLGELDDGLAVFKETAGAAWNQTIVLLVTEFGRTARMNGDQGTDHGTATVAMLAGGAVNGGRVIADWPGLAPANLYQGRDLMPTIDLRSVFKGVLREHLGVPNAIVTGTVFPQSAAAPALLGLVKSSVAAAEIQGEASHAALRSDTAIARYRTGQTISVSRRPEHYLT